MDGLWGGRRVRVCLVRNAVKVDVAVTDAPIRMAAPDSFLSVRPTQSRPHRMGDSITEGTIRSWNKQVGEAVKVDEVVCVIETDKASKSEGVGVLLAGCVLWAGRRRRRCVRLMI